MLRLLDANANRAREALRVMEDYARFVLNDPALCEALKHLRHDFTAATANFTAEAILHRDTPGDVGTETKTSAELKRDDLAHVVTAAGKRLGEALRAIEEYLKTISPADAAKIETLRYRFYEIERRLAQTLRPPACAFAKVRLYVLITESACKIPWLDAAEQAIAGGADCLQLREKNLESGELLTRARQFVKLCRKHGVVSIINDRPDIAMLADADGVHVGQDDLPAAEVRKLIGVNQMLGVSTHCIEQARQAVLDGADYTGVGPIFRSNTKPRDFLPGLEYAREIAAAHLPIPAVAIAGITVENVDEVLGTGLNAVAVTAAVIGCDNITGAARALKRKLVGQTFVSADLSVGQTFLSAAAGDLELIKGRRRLPHWKMDGATYFVTYRIKHGELTMSERKLVLNHLKSGDGQFYKLIAAVVMPDHVHELLQPQNGFDLSRIMKGTKGVSAKRINEHRGTRGMIWQDESFDRIIRDQNELDEKLDYVINNPVKRDLVTDPWDYPALFVKFE